MSIYRPSSSPVFTRLLAPLIEAYGSSESRYSCTELTDLDYLEMGVTRALSESKSGRDFMQRHGDHGRKEVFDEFKSKLEERQFRGSGPEAKTANACFICMAHNLMILCENLILAEEGVENWPEIERRGGRCDRERKRGAHYIATAVQRLTVRSVKFIRWLRNHIYQEVSWQASGARLAHVYANY